MKKCKKVIPSITLYANEDEITHLRPDGFSFWTGFVTCVKEHFAILDGKKFCSPDF